jgi:hypothetical protein
LIFLLVLLLHLLHPSLLCTLFRYLLFRHLLHLLFGLLYSLL